MFLILYKVFLIQFLKQNGLVKQNQVNQNLYKYYQIVVTMSNHERVIRDIFPGATRIQPLTRYRNDSVDGYRVDGPGGSFIVEIAPISNRAGYTALETENRILNKATGITGIAQLDTYRPNHRSGLSICRVLSKQFPNGTMMKDHHWLVPQNAEHHLRSTVSDAHSRGLSRLTIGQNNIV